MGHQFVREPLRAEEAHRLANACKSVEEKRIVWTLLDTALRVNVGAEAFDAISHVKVQNFAAEAKSLDAARMLEIQPQKHYTLAAALIRAQVARTLDDLGETLIKRMTKIHHKGQEALADYRRRQQRRTDEHITVLHNLVAVTKGRDTARKMLAAMHAVVGDQAEQIFEDCETHAAYAGDNCASLLWRFYKSHRQTLFELLGEVRLVSTSRDTLVQDALEFVRPYWISRRDWLALDPDKPLDLSWVPEKWWKLVTGSSNRLPTQVDRRQFELCLLGSMHTLVVIQSRVPGCSFSRRIRSGSAGVAS